MPETAGRADWDGTRRTIVSLETGRRTPVCEPAGGGMLGARRSARGELLVALLPDDNALAEEL